MLWLGLEIAQIYWINPSFQIGLVDLLFSSPQDHFKQLLLDNKWLLLTWSMLLRWFSPYVFTDFRLALDFAICMECFKGSFSWRTVNAFELTPLLFIGIERIGIYNLFLLLLLYILFSSDLFDGNIQILIRIVVRAVNLSTVIERLNIFRTSSKLILDISESF